MAQRIAQQSCTRESNTQRKEFIASRPVTQSRELIVIDDDDDLVVSAPLNVKKNVSSVVENVKKNVSPVVEKSYTKVTDKPDVEVIRVDDTVSYLYHYTVLMLVITKGLSVIRITEC